MFIIEKNEVIIRIWLDADDKFGHASLQTRNIYVSIYPIKPLSLLDRSGIKFKPKSLEEDAKKYQYNANPVIVKLHQLEIHAIEEEYEQFVKGGYKFSIYGSTLFKDPKTHNCCSLVAHLLIKGGIKKNFKFSRELLRACFTGYVIGVATTFLAFIYDYLNDFETVPISKNFSEFTHILKKYPVLFSIPISAFAGIAKLPIPIISKILNGKFELNLITSTNITVVFIQLLIMTSLNLIFNVPFFERKDLLPAIKVFLPCSMVAGGITKWFGGSYKQSITSAVSFGLRIYFFVGNNFKFTKISFINLIAQDLTSLMSASIIPKFFSFSGIVFRANDLKIFTEEAQKKENSMTKQDSAKKLKNSITENKLDTNSLKKNFLRGICINGAIVVTFFALRKAYEYGTISTETFNFISPINSPNVI